jgi:hypothetical protein
MHTAKRIKILTKKSVPLKLGSCLDSFSFDFNFKGGGGGHREGIEKQFSLKVIYQYETHKAACMVFDSS